MALGIVIFAAAILVIIMVHEYGHFVAAKLLGFKAPKFFVGFGPTLWSFTRGETEYGIKALPIGGFVKIAGMSPYEDIAPEDRERSYTSRPLWARAIVIGAGSATHWVIAFVVLVVTAMTIGYPTGHQTTEVAGIERSVAGRTTAAAEAGFQAGDRIVAIDGRRVTRWAEVRHFIRAHPGDAATFTVVRDGKRIDLHVRFGKALAAGSGRIVAYAPPGGSLPPARAGRQVIGFLGVASAPEYRTTGFGRALTRSGGQLWTLTRDSAVGIGQVFSMVGDGRLWAALGGQGPRQPSGSPIGIVGAGRIAGESSATGNWLALVGLIVGFTVFVGLMNLLPLPPLDGGHLAVVLWEAVTGRQVDVRKLVPIAAAVISFFVLLSVAVLYLDLARPIQSPF